MLVRVIDFETTGMEPPAAICEIGYCDIEVNVADPTTGLLQAKVGEPHAFLVNPGHPIPPEVRAIHHISDADVAAAGSPDLGLKHLMAGEPAYFAAHNAKFEQQFFGGGTVPWLCSYKIALRYYPDAPSHSNQTLRYLLGLDEVMGRRELAMPPHRAGPDAYVTAYILAHMIMEAKATIEDMVRWSAGPALLPKITFGKHRGSKWEDVGSDYLEWIVNKSDLDADTKANARHHLKKRAA